MSSLSAVWCLFLLLGLQNAGPKIGQGQGVQPDHARLRELLYSRDRQTEQSQAALLLVQSGTSDAQDLIRESLTRWDRPDVFKAAASAVGMWRDSRYLHPLLQALASESIEVRQAAMDALSKLDARIVVRWLTARAEDAGQPMTARTAAVTTLGRSLQKPAVVALLNLLSHDNVTIRQAASAALEEVSGQQFANSIQWQSWWLPYKDCSEEEWLAGRAAFFAERNRSLQDRVRRAEENVLAMQQKLYARTPAQDRVGFCKDARESDYPQVRREAVVWMQTLLQDANPSDKATLTDLLLQASRDSAESVQRQAVLALEKVDDPRAVERLLELLTMGNPSIRAAAAHGLGRHRSKVSPLSAELKTRTLHALDQALNDPNLQVVANAAESLGALGATQAAPRLADLLRHPSEVVRKSVSFALEEVPSVAVLPAVLTAMDDPDAVVRNSLVGVLGKIGGKSLADEKLHAQVIKHLERVLVQDAARVVRERAATVLGELGGPTELSVLWQRVRAMEDESVREKAWQAMLEIFTRSANWPLIQQWDQSFTEQKELERRLEMLLLLRERWSRLETAKALIDPVTAALIQAQLNSRKWPDALPLALDMAKKAANDTELRERLRWLLVIARQALEDKKPTEVQYLLKETEEMVRKCRDLAPEFDALRQAVGPISIK